MMRLIFFFAIMFQCATNLGTVNGKLLSDIVFTTLMKSNLFRWDKKSHEKVCAKISKDAYKSEN